MVETSRTTRRAGAGCRASPARGSPRGPWGRARSACPRRARRAARLAETPAGGRLYPARKPIPWSPPYVRRRSTSFWLPRAARCRRRGARCAMRPVQHDGARRPSIVPAPRPSGRGHADGEAGQRGHGRRAGWRSCSSLDMGQNQPVGWAGSGGWPQVDQYVTTMNARENARKAENAGSLAFAARPDCWKAEVDEQAAESVNGADDADCCAGEASCLHRAAPSSLAVVIAAIA